MLNLIGQTFERLTVRVFYERITRGSRRGTYWYCDCSCGTKNFVASTQALRKGAKGGVRSCGCLMRERAAFNCITRSRTHGETSGGTKRSETPEYRCWKTIKNRCCNPKFKQYYDYGGRGIRVCDRWLHSFSVFLEDLGRKPSREHSIERRDTNGDYSPDNCYWATAAEQQRNKRTTVWITIDGVTRVRVDWLRILGVSRSTYTWRRQQGWSEVDALLGRLKTEVP